MQNKENGQPITPDLIIMLLQIYNNVAGKNQEYAIDNVIQRLKLIELKQKRENKQ